MLTGKWAPKASVTLHNGLGFVGNTSVPWPTGAGVLGTWSIGADWVSVLTGLGRGALG